ncbi:hypothetical protein TWF173_006195 [Orbilia oligospora]|nr:hypothetical protein TWF173_006195 [Orbilia oligospora]
MPYPAQWNWGQGHPSGTVTEVADHGSLSIQSSNGNTITRNAEPSNPAVHLQQDSGTDVVKKASELEIKSSSDDNKDDGDGNDGKLQKPFPPPRQSAPISRPPDTAQEEEEANLSIEEQVKLAEERDKQAEKKDGDDVDIDNGNGNTTTTTTTTTIHGHTNGDKTATTQPPEQLMDLREEVQEKPTKPEASVGEKRGRSEEPTTVASDEQDHTSGSSEKNGGDKNDTQEEEVPEPESKKPRVEESNKEVTDPTAPASTELDQSKPVETAEAPKKKAGRPKKEETKPVTGERKNSVSSRTRSKAIAEDVSI